MCMCTFCVHVEHERAPEKFKNRFKKESDRWKQNREERSTEDKIKQRYRNGVCGVGRVDSLLLW